MRFGFLIILCLFIKNSNAQTSTALSVGFLSELKLDSLYIHSKTDSIMTSGIQHAAFPGAQLLVAKQGKIIFHKAYGYHTYDSIQAVRLDDIYDIASVTKILGPLPALMKLYDEGKIDLDAPFSTYWPAWKHRKDKRNLTLREILAHQAGLKPYIVFLTDVLKNEKLKKRFVRNSYSRKFNRPINDSLFIHHRFEHKMFRQINRSKVSTSKKYLYSGLSFMIYPTLISELSGIPYAQYLQENFYQPLGATKMGFVPSTKTFNNAFVPTEHDTIYRKNIVKGWVHDENASLLGGISGNAGIFATANDLAIMMQLYLQYGVYDGKRYLKEATVREFTSVQYLDNENRRGLGFDKPLLGNSTLSLSESYPAPETGATSFGHSGFTGTFVWADPENELVFIFLSNRVYPTRDHRNLYSLNIRPALHQIFYKAATTATH